MLLEQFTQEGFSLTHEYAGSLVQCGTKHFTAARVRMTVGGRVAVNWQQWHCPGPPFLCGASSDTREPHIFKLLNILASRSWEGRRASHNDLSAAKSVHRVHRHKRSAEFVYREVDRNAADNGLCLRSSSRAYV
ncbi:hypothetical protein EVAR_91904_1 [Eumeta japonica]|uniref:Uncharacterized protein n=1 Tax=Eumeta variegata TaxID=151549 RepID=A0A4C1SZ76_EUMVA|nr:hypothetical protein EVAR_91904_1 [Eumeta japonica]